MTRDGACMLMLGRVSWHGGGDAEESARGVGETRLGADIWKWRGDGSEVLLDGRLVETKHTHVPILNTSAKPVASKQDRVLTVVVDIHDSQIRAAS
jgi:hypothetical protein